MECSQIRLSLSLAPLLFLTLSSIIPPSLISSFQSLCHLCPTPLFCLPDLLCLRKPLFTFCCTTVSPMCTPALSPLSVLILSPLFCFILQHTNTLLSPSCFSVGNNAQEWVCGVWRELKLLFRDVRDILLHTQKGCWLDNG